MANTANPVSVNRCSQVSVPARVLAESVDQDDDGARSVVRTPGLAEDVGTVRGSMSRFVVFHLCIVSEAPWIRSRGGHRVA